MKKNITPLSGFLPNVLQLRTFSFNYLNQSDNQPKQIGFMAQDVERFYPSLVTNGEIKTLNYAGLSVVAIGAIQEQQQQIEQLKTANESLRRQLEEQQNTLLELRKLVCLSNPNAEICRK